MNANGSWVMLALLTGCGAPPAGDSLSVTGVVEPMAGSCVYPSPATAFRARGQMEIGADNTAVNEYVAVLQATNNSSARNGNVTIVDANVQFSYPTLPPLAQRDQARTSDATGVVEAGSQANITLKLVTGELACQLAHDPDFQSRMASDGSVPIVAHVRLQGRDANGGSVTSNGFVFTVDALPPATLNNCNLLRCPAGQSAIMNVQCFPGQDDSRCVCG